MNVDPSKIPSLMDNLEKQNVKTALWLRDKHGYEIDVESCQKIFPPGPYQGQIPTLERNVYRKSTPMLDYRFKHAGSWVKAYIGNTWFDIHEMESIWNDEIILDKVRSTQEYYESSAIALVPWDRLSLFGGDPVDMGEIYLLWDEDESIEPRIISYISNDEAIFTSLGDFILYCTQDTLD